MAKNLAEKMAKANQEVEKEVEETAPKAKKAKVAKEAPAVEKEAPAVEKEVEDIKYEDDEGYVNTIEMLQAEYLNQNPDDEKPTKKFLKAVLKAYHAILTEAAFKNGKLRLGEFGSLITVPVVGRKGVSKMSGEEKAWETKDHWTIKLRLTSGTAAEIDALEAETKEFASDALKAE